MASRKSTQAASGFRTEALLKLYEESAGSGEPKRVRLYRAILKMLEYGFLNPDDRLPTDLELAATLPVSLATIQSSLKMLAEQGLIVRRKRNGSVVSSRDFLANDYVFFRFVGRSGRLLMPVRTIDIDVGETSEQGEWARFLGDCPSYLRVMRTLDIAGKLKALSEFYFSDPRLRLLLDLPKQALMDVAIRPLLQFRFGLPTDSIDWLVMGCVLSNDVCHRIGVEQGHVGQRVDAQIYTFGEKPLGFHRILLPTTDYAMQIVDQRHLPSKMTGGGRGYRYPPL